jgi:hypothetical protein
MARDLSGASQRMVSGNSIGGAGLSEFTIFIEARRNSLTTEGWPAGIGASSTANCHIGFRGDTAGDPVQARAQNSSVVAVNAGSYAADAWKRCALTCSNNVSVGLDIYNENVTANVSNSPVYAPSSSSLIYLGSWQDGSGLFDGMVAKFALWSERLTPADIASLVAGFSPRRIRPQSRIAYTPLIRGLGDLHGLLASWTEFGSPTVYDHPRSYGV